MTSKKLLSLFFVLSSLTCSTFGSSTIIGLNEENWTKILKGEWMIEFFAPWCPACRGLHQTWSEFSEWTDDLGLEGVAQVDVTENPGLSGRFMVTALPTIYHVKDGVFRQYRGARDKDSFISFIEDKKWSEVEPVSQWKDPNSVQMTLVSYFFKMSMMLRNIHTLITEEMGYPYWVSYVGFAVATIMLGAILGLVLVCIIDLIYPPGRHPATVVISQQQQKRKKDKDSDDEGDEADDLPEDDQDEEEEQEEEQEEEKASESPAVRKRRAKKAD